MEYPSTGNFVPILERTDVEKLQTFHKQHFPNQSVPQVDDPHEDGDAEIQDDDLGFYSDGVRRTLTDEQISMFRNSEIHRLLQERRRKREEDEAGQGQKLSYSQGQKESRTSLKKQNQVHTCFDNDDKVHGRETVNELLYDDVEPVRSTTSAAASKTFLWPKLG